MTDPTPPDPTLLDHPYVLGCLFHPRPGYATDPPDTARDLLIPVADGVVIGGRFHLCDLAAVNLLFFHGNGEIVEDYDELGPFYNRFGINLLAVDYRGYGNSSGQPTTTNLLQDAHAIFHYVGEWLTTHGYRGPRVVMGRSLGSAAALELASHYPERIAGLIIESGFAYTVPLLQLIGVDTDALGIQESQGIGNLAKIRTFNKPTLIIHAERDHIIPFSDGQALYDASPAADKRLLPIPFANHNNIFAVGLQDYLRTIHAFTSQLR